MKRVIVRTAVVTLIVAAASVIVIGIPPSLVKVSWWRFLHAQEKSGHHAGHTENYDANRNGVAEQYSISKGIVTVQEEARVIWSSPRSWWVDDFALTDVNGDGTVDLALALWKQGSFGRFKPLGYETTFKERTDIKNHFFVLTWANGSLRQIWASSSLAAPNCDFKFVDIDGNTFLQVREGAYKKPGQCVPEFEALWQWNGFGFTNISRQPLTMPFK